MATTHPELRRGTERGLGGVWAHLLLLGATAVLLGLAFPRLGVAWLAHWALVPAAVLATRSGSARRLAWTSWLVFFVWWLVMCRWLAMVVPLGYIAVCAVMAVYPMLSLQLMRWLDQRLRLPMVAAVPLAWVSLEFVRGHLLAGGFGWFALAHTQAPFDVGQAPGRLMQTADLFGEHTAGLIVAMTNGLLADLCLRRWMHIGRAGRPRLGKALPAGTVLWAVVMVMGSLYGHRRLAQTPALLEPGPRIAVVQTNVVQDNRKPPTPEEVAQAWAELLQMTYVAAVESPPPDLIVWPETMVPRPLNDEAHEVWIDSADVEQTVRQIARQVRSHLVAGSDAEFDHYPLQLPDGRTVMYPARRHNSAYLYFSDGAPGGRYDKMHRVPFGEFIPWVEWSPPLKRLFVRLFSPWGQDWTIRAGQRLVRFEAPVLVPTVDGGEPTTMRVVRFATPICFEDAVPRVCRRMVYERGEKRADLLINLTNDGWYPGTMQGVQHLQIAAYRCVENRVPMARSVNTGVSGFIDSTGAILAQVQVGGQRQQVSGVADERLWLDPRVTFFGRWGQTPMWLLVTFTALLSLAGWARRGKLAP